MKTFFAPFISAVALFLTLPQAQATVDSVDHIGACADISKMAVLAKDNMPYWAERGNDDNTVEACYRALTTVISQGNDEDIKDVLASFKNIEIFPQDFEFSQFITNANRSNGINPFDHDTNSPESVLPVNGEIYFNLPTALQ